MIGNPKPYRERLKRNSVDWRKLVDELYKRENHFCQGCGKWLRRCEAAPHHIKTVGAFGGDVLENLAMLCKECHEVTSKEVSELLERVKAPYDEAVSFAKGLLAICEANGIGVDKDKKKAIKNVSK